MLSVYADGASSAKGGRPGGWAYVVVRDEVHVLAAQYGSDPVTTNNIMELTAAIQGLETAYALLRAGKIRSDEVVELVSDSQYVLGLAAGAYVPEKNLELAKRVRELTLLLKARTRWVKGHTGDVWNERCDSLAGRGKKAITNPPKT